MIKGPLCGPFAFLCHDYPNDAHSDNKHCVNIYLRATLNSLSNMRMVAFGFKFMANSGHMRNIMQVISLSLKFHTMSYI